MERVKRLDPNAKGAWGQMTGEQMLGHVTGVVRYTLGQGAEMPYKGTFKTRYIYRPLILNGLVKIPHNVRVPPPKGMKTMPTPHGTVDGLREALHEYLARAQAGDLDPPHHPFFGDLGVDGWAKFHYRHFEHHLEQFGL